MSKLLEVRNLTLDYLGQKPRRVLEDLSFSLEAGGSLALVGESGAGKSMTSLAIMGLLPQGIVQSGGSILFAGRALSSLDEQEYRALRGGKMAIIMQNPMSAFDPLCSIFSHFRESLLAHKPALSKSQILDKTKESLSLSGFTSPDQILDLYPFQMSGGMLQRVMIALALALSEPGQPSLLIADEATSDLDLELQKDIVELLRQRQAASGLALLLITHDFSVAASLAKDMLVLRQGRMVEQGPLASIFAAPTQAYTKELLAAHEQLYDQRFAALVQPAASQSPLGEDHASA